MEPFARQESSLRRLGRRLGFVGRPGDDSVAGLLGVRRRPSELHVKGRAVSCPICANTQFWQREGKLQTTGMTFIGLDAFNASAVCHVCSSCGHILWFLPP